MIRFKVHYTILNVEDYIIVEGDTIEEIKKIIKDQMKARGLNPDKNNIWSEEID